MNKMEYAQNVWEECLNNKMKPHEMSHELARRVGISQRMAQDYMIVVSEGSKKLIQNVKEKQISVKVAVLFIRSASNQDDLMDLYLSLNANEKKIFVEKVRSGESLEQIKNSNLQKENKIYQENEKIIKTKKNLLELMEETLEHEELQNLVEICKKFVEKYERN